MRIVVTLQFQKVTAMKQRGSLSVLSCMPGGEITNIMHIGSIQGLHNTVYYILCKYLSG